MARQLVRMLFVLTVIAVGVGIDGAYATQTRGTRMPIRLAGRPADTVVVEMGDTLWKISSKHLSATRSQTPVAPYWRQVIAENTSELRSGDPDLIYPGELISLPPPRP